MKVHLLILIVSLVFGLSYIAKAESHAGYQSYGYSSPAVNRPSGTLCYQFPCPDRFGYPHFGKKRHRTFMIFMGLDGSIIVVLGSGGPNPWFAVVSPSSNNMISPVGGYFGRGFGFGQMAF